MTDRTNDGDRQWREVSRRTIRETVEDVVYVEQRIKKFNREGAESMELIKIPEFVEREIEVDIVTYKCDRTNETKDVRENERTVS